MNSWIKINDRLPLSPESGSVILIIASYSIERKYFHVMPAQFQRNNFYDSYNERIHIDDPYWPITHWMPLPEAPNEKN